VNDRPIAYGIDFGTSNSLISIAWPDRVDVVDVGGRRVPQNLPSVIYLNADGNREAGDLALKQFLISAGINSRLLVGIKSDLSDPRFRRTTAWGLSWTPVDLVAVVMRALKSAGDALVGTSVERVVLGHPVAFVGSEGEDFEQRQDLAVGRIVAAAKQVGFREVETLEEPSAAAQEESIPSGLVVALDFGGGTFDVAVVDFRPDGAEVIGLAGASVGGERFDQLLFNAKVAPELGLLDEYVSPEGERHRLPARVLANSRSMLDLRSLLLDPTLPPIIARYRQYRGGEKLERLEQLLYGGFAYEFYEAVEEAKIRLSIEQETFIDFHHRRFDVHTPVTRAEFEALIGDDMSLLEITIATALSDANVSAADVVQVVRTGGSSTIPLFVELVSATFSRAVMTQRPPYTTVVQGLGHFAQGVWG
jgi:hypothetical chaperone protein